MKKDSHIAVITGITSSLGSEIARNLIKNRYDHIIVTGRNKVKLVKEINEMKEGNPGKIIDSYNVDLSNRKDIDQWLSKIETQLSQVDLLINNPAVFTVAPYLETSLEECEADFKINFFAPFLINQCIGRYMLQKNRGTIVNIGSSSGYGGARNTAAYVATKHALLGLTRCMNAEWKDQGIRSIYFAPGSMKSPMGKKVVGQDFETFIDPVEAARVLSMIVELEGNAAIDEISLGRMIYR